MLRPAPDDWTPFQAVLDDELARRFPGDWGRWWKVQNGFVLTLALRQEKID